MYVQIVWIESKKVIEYKGNIGTFLAEDLLMILLCGISERVFFCLLSPLESLKLGLLEMRMLVQH